MKSRMLQKTTLMSHCAVVSSTSSASFNAKRRNLRAFVPTRYFRSILLLKWLYSAFFRCLFLQSLFRTGIAFTRRLLDG